MFFAETDWTAPLVLAFFTGIAGVIGSIGSIILAVMNARKSVANQEKHEGKLEEVKAEFNGVVTRAVEAAKKAAEAQVREAFRRGVEARGTGVGGEPPVDPEILEAQRRKTIREGNGPTIPMDQITEQNFGKP